MKQIIEAFNNVLELIEQQERELDDFIADEEEDPRQRRRSRGSSINRERNVVKEEAKEPLDASQPSQDNKTNSVLCMSDYVDKVNENKV